MHKAAWSPIRRREKGRGRAHATSHGQGELCSTGWMQLWDGGREECLPAVAKRNGDKRERGKVRRENETIENVYFQSCLFSCHGERCFLFSPLVFRPIRPASL